MSCASIELVDAGAFTCSYQVLGGAASHLAAFPFARNRRRTDDLGEWNRIFCCPSLAAIPLVGVREAPDVGIAAPPVFAS